MIKQLLLGNKWAQRQVIRLHFCFLVYLFIFPVVSPYSSTHWSHLLHLPELSMCRLAITCTSSYHWSYILTPVFWHLVGLILMSCQQAGFLLKMAISILKSSWVPHHGFVKFILQLPTCVPMCNLLLTLHLTYWKFVWCWKNNNFADRWFHLIKSMLLFQAPMEFGSSSEIC